MKRLKRSEFEIFYPSYIDDHAHFAICLLLLKLVLEKQWTPCSMLSILVGIV